jgi:UDP-3-O-[3-hydroxymyristoyl] glucosamine N-acyltransferase
LISISKIAESINGRIEGNSDLLIEDICELKAGEQNCISFIEHPHYTNLYIESDAAAVIAGMKIDLPEVSKTVIRVENPSLSFNIVSELFRPNPISEIGIHNSAIISDSATIGENVSIGANVVIGKKAVIGDNVRIGSNTSIGRNNSDTILNDNDGFSTRITVLETSGKSIFIPAMTAAASDSIYKFV